MTRPSLTLRIRAQAARAERRDFVALARHLDAEVWRRFYVSLGEKHRARARAMAWALILTVAAVLSVGALSSVRGCL